ncbi:MAG: hypothetical protein EON52_14330 [Actinomycetales bacterium]|nr:MAG: hypothetical protein EON52_14330 [Actinomycetales bacterium]
MPRRARPSPSSDHGSPLVATSDPVLLEAALRWCAAAGATPDVAHDEVGLRRSWRTASAVLVGQDLARPDLSRRDRVVLVSRERESAWAPAVLVGASGVAVVGQEDDAVTEVLQVLDGRREGCLVSVVPAVGGAGASTLACYLALGASGRGLGTLLLDADSSSGGLDLVLGAEHAKGARWPQLLQVDGSLGASTLPRVLPRAHGVAVLAPGAEGGLPEAVGGVLDAAVRGFDVVVADVPRAAREQAADDTLARSVLTVLVVPERVHAVAAGRRAVRELQERCASVVAVSAGARGGTGATAVGELLGVPTVARVRHERRIGLCVESGRGPGRSRRWQRAAADVLDLLGLEGSDGPDR